MAYRFCPECGEQLEARTVDEQRLQACPKCGFVHYNNPRPCVGVLLVEGGKVLLVQRAVEPFKGYWDIPGGFLNSDEHPTEAARREMLEETGLAVVPTEVLGFWTDRYGEADYYTLSICYLAETAGGREKAGSDAVTMRWFPLDDLPEKIAFNWEREALELLRTRLSD
jgi:ADP-ribose pyrophosphatase YjhB (NUDIX family)